MLVRNSGKWKGRGFPSEQVEFKLTIDRFDSENSYSKELCATAILASGKKNDDVSKLYREQKRELCALLDYKNKENSGLVGPVIKYCRVTGHQEQNSDLYSDDFSFSSDQNTYFEFSPVAMGFSSGTAQISVGKCIAINH
jgi:hypothetical protein